MSDLFIIPEELIATKIYTLRGSKVMLDRDLALLYEVKGFRLKEQVKRNLYRFPANFMFQLTEEETNIMVSQNAIPNIKHLGGSLPYAFTEHGVLQLSNVLKSDRANQVSVGIIEVFVKMRELLMTHSDILLQLEEMRQSITGHEDKIDMIHNYLIQFINDKKEPRIKVGYKK